MFTVSMPESDARPALQQPMTPEEWRVRSVRWETHDTFTLELTPRRGPSAFSFRPGQFNMLYLFGIGEVPISISGDPARQDALIHTARAVGSVTRALAQLKPSQILGVRGPFGSAWPVEQARGRDVIVIAGGIGLPPLRPALYHILDHRAEYGHFTLLYGARTPRDLLFVHELEEWRSRFDFDVQVTVDAAGEDWHGTVGVVPALIRRAHFDPAGAIAMMVGPEIMMRFATLELTNLGMPEGNIFLSMERNMKCTLGYCGHCQFGPTFVCKDGPVFSYERLAWLLNKREV